MRKIDKLLGIVADFCEKEVNKPDNETMLKFLRDEYSALTHHLEKMLGGKKEYAEFFAAHREPIDLDFMRGWNDARIGQRPDEGHRDNQQYIHGYNALHVYRRDMGDPLPFFKEVFESEEKNIRYIRGWQSASQQSELDNCPARLRRDSSFLHGRQNCQAYHQFHTLVTEFRYDYFDNPEDA